ncbi:MAG: AMP-binding protein [Deltaproteobacteria bacterium]|nr:AMP-binding protein [Deltaproteobacteria bacterium]
MPDWQTQTIGQALREATGTWGDKEALISADRRYTYEELYDDACRLALGMSRLGIGKGDHVGTIFPIALSWIITKYALHLLGAVLVPLNVNFKKREMEYVLRQARIKTLITYDELPYGNYFDILEDIDPAISAAEGKRIRSESLPSLETVICLSPAGRQYDFCHSFDRIENLGEGYKKEDIDGLLKNVRPSDPCNILFTSGSTAFPKGAVHNHTSLLGIGEHLWGKTFNLSPSDTLLCYFPFYHIAGCVYNPLGAMMRGCALVIHDFIPGDILELIQKEKISFFGGFDAHLNGIQDHPDWRQYDLNSVKFILLATGPEWYDKCRTLFPKADIIANHYGFTEGTGVSVMPDETDEHVRKYTNGKPWPGIEVKVIDPETGERVPPGQGGELCLRGWSRLQGYFENPEETAKAIDAEGFFHSGDYGWVDENGSVYYRGRYKMMVKTGGENVSQREVEIFLEGMPGVKSVQVIGVPDEKWGEAVTAVIELEPGADMTLEDVVAFSRGNIARFKVPKHVLFIQGEEWPLLGAGKVNKIALREIAVARLDVG